ncbi:MAG TPA: hypothetical protein VMT78_03720, partial [Terriglobia bacterium]|nr:hypothetical protein [Terriglobia bacterium]
IGQGPLWNLPAGFAQRVGSRMTVIPRPHDRLEPQWGIPAGAVCGLIAIFVGVLLLTRPVSALPIFGVIYGYVTSDAGLYACLALGVAVWFARRILVRFASFCSSIGVATTSAVLRLPSLTRRS